MTELKAFRVSLMFFVLIYGIIVQISADKSIYTTKTLNPFLKSGELTLKDDVTTIVNETTLSKNIFRLTYDQPYRGIPYLAFAIKSYRANDNLQYEYFDIKTVNLFREYFELKMSLKGQTNLRILKIHFLLVDREFPLHLDAFNSIQANYSKGPLMNVSSPISSVQPRYYFNTINYTNLAGLIGSSYKSFKYPLTRYVALSWLNGLQFSEIDKVYWYLFFNQFVNVVSVDELTITIGVGRSARVTYVSMSIVIFDIQEFKDSKIYEIFHQKDLRQWGLNAYVTTIQKNQFQSGLYGLSDFQVYTADSFLEFTWQYTPQTQSFLITKSIPYSSSYNPYFGGGLQWKFVDLFYSYAYSCAVPYVFLDKNNLICSKGCKEYEYENRTSYICQKCNFRCYQCKEGPNAGCSACKLQDNRQLVNKSCQCKKGFASKTGQLVCLNCSELDSNCVQCMFDSQNQMYCSQCKKDYMMLRGKCVFCNISFCVTHVAVNNECSCGACDVDNGYFLNQFGKCEHCKLAGCLKCSSSSNCTDCDKNSSYILNKSSGYCSLCSIGNYITTLREILSKSEGFTVSRLLTQTSSYTALETHLNQAICLPNQYVNKRFGFVNDEQKKSYKSEFIALTILFVISIVINIVQVIILIRKKCNSTSNPSQKYIKQKKNIVENISTHNLNESHSKENKQQILDDTLIAQIKNSPNTSQPQSKDNKMQRKQQNEDDSVNAFMAVKTKMNKSGLDKMG